MVNHCIDHPIPNCLGYDMLGLLNRVQPELLANIDERNLAIADIDLLEAKLDNGVAQSLHKGQGLVRLEHIFEGVHELAELFHVA